MKNPEGDRADALVVGRHVGSAANGYGGGEGFGMVKYLLEAPHASHRQPHDIEAVLVHALFSDQFFYQIMSRHQRPVRRAGIIEGKDHGSLAAVRLHQSPVAVLGTLRHDDDGGKSFAILRF